MYSGTRPAHIRGRLVLVASRPSSGRRGERAWRHSIAKGMAHSLRNTRFLPPRGTSCYEVFIRMAGRLPRTSFPPVVISHGCHAAACLPRNRNNILSSPAACRDCISRTLRRGSEPMPSRFLAASLNDCRAAYRRFISIRLFKICSERAAYCLSRCRQEFGRILRALKPAYNKPVFWCGRV